MDNIQKVNNSIKYMLHFYLQCMFQTFLTNTYFAKYIKKKTHMSPYKAVIILAWFQLKLKGLHKY
jgi:hypothetical protein